MVAIFNPWWNNTGMSSEHIDTTEAAGILGVDTNRAALAIIKRAALPVEYGKYKAAYIRRDSVEQLAEIRRSRVGKPGRPNKNSRSGIN